MVLDDKGLLTLEETHKITELLVLNTDEFLHFIDLYSREAFIKVWLLREDRVLDGEASMIIKIDKEYLFFSSFLSHLTTNDYKHNLPQFLDHVLTHARIDPNNTKSLVQLIINRIHSSLESINEDATHSYQSWDIETGGKELGTAISKGRNTAAYVDAIIESYITKPSITCDSKGPYEVINDWLNYPPDRVKKLRTTHSILNTHPHQIYLVRDMKGPDVLPNIFNNYWNGDPRKDILFPQDNRLKNLAEYLLIAISSTLLAEENRYWINRWMPICYKILADNEGGWRSADPMVYRYIRCIERINKKMLPWLIRNELQSAWYLSNTLIGLDYAEKFVSKEEYPLSEASLYLALVGAKIFMAS